MDFFDDVEPGPFFNQVGEFRELTEPICGFIRLRDPVTFSDLTEVPVPTRFVFLYIGPPVRIS